MLPDLGLHWQVCIGRANIFKRFILALSLKIDVGGIIRQNSDKALFFIVREQVILLVLGVGLRFSI